MTISDTCYHCGLPNDPHQEHTATVLGETRHFCCPGCQAVASAIVANGLEDYYQFRTEPAVTGDAQLESTLAQLALYDDPALQEEFVYDEGANKSIQLTVEGITCAACGWLIEKQLARVNGIRKVAVNVAERRASVDWNDDAIKLSDIMTTMTKIGYQALPFQPDQHEASFKREQKTFLKKLGLAGLMTMQVMMLMAGLYFDLFGQIEAETRNYFHWVALVLTTPVVFYSGSQFYLGALKALSARTVNMDVPVTLAVFGTYFAGIKATITQTGEVYYESICMFVFLLLLSRFLEHRSRQRAAQISANMMQHIPVTANRIEPESGDTVQCLAKQLKEGDRVRVKSGEVIPIDGVIENGTAEIDESMLTGEFMPVTKSAQQTVYGGTVNQVGHIEINVSGTLKNALVNQIIRLQASAMAAKPKAALVADKFSRVFVAAVLTIAASTFAYWSYVGSGDAFWITISVLVATCPCALGLATPTAVTCAMAQLNKHGVLLKRADVLEQINDVTTFAFDKTGTVTQGKFSLATSWYLEGVEQTKVLQVVQSLESLSEHPIASAFQTCDNTLDVEGFTTFPGQGIEGKIDGQTYRLGSASFVGVKDNSPLADANVFLQANDILLAAYSVTDTIKPDVADTLAQLKQYHLLLLSGDEQSLVEKVGQAVGIEDMRGNKTPQQKLATVQSLQAAGESVVMLGDGINDAPVLGSADVAIAVGNATDVAKSAADIILLSERLSLLTLVFDMAKATKVKVKQNMAWAIGYNLLILPFAVSGVLTPWMAVVGMSLSSIIVVTNSMRLLK